MSTSADRMRLDLPNNKKSSMSKPVALEANKPSLRNASDTRARILHAARRRFSCDSYENVGTRDIAADAGVDAALVNRYFGGKENLFVEVIAGAFRVENHLSDKLDDLGAHLVRQIIDATHERAAGDFDALALLLRAAGSPTTAHMVAVRFHADFVKPLAKLLRGRDAELRAALIASYVIGLATMKQTLGSALLSEAAQRKALDIAGAAIQSCVTPSS
jgi:AcrR family transcriptional regulator